MKRKILKISLILLIVSISMGCSKIKTFSLVGNYKGGNLIMLVAPTGEVSFKQIDGSLTEEGVAATILGFNFNGGNPILTPWDLLDEKASYSFEYTEKIEDIGYNEQMQFMPIYYDANWKLEFTKDKKTINCRVTLTIPIDKGVSGSIDFSK